jgi:serine/threonine protein kinase
MWASRYLRPRLFDRRTRVFCQLLPASMAIQVGVGSYGMVFKGKWKGVDVAVKRFIKQTLDERRLLEFRAEMAFLSELHHPNIVLFIGTPRASYKGHTC